MFSSVRKESMRVLPFGFSQASAVRELVRAEEVEHLLGLISVLRWPWESWAMAVARWMRTQIEFGKLRCEPADPDDYGRIVWHSPGTTLRDRRGHREDFALLLVALLRLGSLDVRMTLGTADGDPHAWVEGTDAWGGFHIDPTTGRYHTSRPADWDPAYTLDPPA